MTLLKDLLFLLKKKSDNEIKNIFLHDEGSNFKNLSSNIAEISTTTIFAENGFIENRRIFLFNGQILTSKKNSDNEIVKFQQLSIDLTNLKTSTIKAAKIQETSTLKLLNCLIKNNNLDNICNEGFKKEIIPTLSRRIIIPVYIPLIAIMVGLMLIKSQKIYFFVVGRFLP